MEVIEELEDMEVMEDIDDRGNERDVMRISNRT